MLGLWCVPCLVLHRAGNQTQSSMYARQTLQQLSSTPRQRKSLKAIPAPFLRQRCPLSVPTEKPLPTVASCVLGLAGSLSTLPRGKKVNGLVPRKKVFHGASDWLSAPSCRCLGDASLKGRHGGGWLDNPWSSGSLLSCLVIVFLGCYDELSVPQGRSPQLSEFTILVWGLCPTRSLLAVKSSDFFLI